MRQLAIEQMQSRAEFYLCLAHAFLPPDTEQLWEAIRDALADDLEGLGEALGYDIGNAVADLRTLLATIPDQMNLLQGYSALFLAPPRPVNINTGIYLDGIVNGGSLLAMEATYLRCGLKRCQHFKDLSDHVSVQLEFVASRYLQYLDKPEAIAEAEQFLADFAVHWLPPFIADLQKAGVASNPWLPLARMLLAAVAQDASAAPQASAQLRQQSALEQARRVRAQEEIGEEQMAFIARRLQEQGLATDHLSVPPELRDEERGLWKGGVPSPRRGSRHG